jgi:hypothetical protein
MLDDDVACIMDTDEDGEGIFYKIHFDSTKKCIEEDLFNGIH